MVHGVLQILKFTVAKPREDEISFQPLPGLPCMKFPIHIHIHIQIFRGYPWIYPYPQTFIPRTCSPEFLPNTAVQKRLFSYPTKKHDADISLLKLLKKIGKVKNKRTFALKCTILVEYVKFRDNLHNFIDAVFGRPLGRTLGTIGCLPVLGLPVTHVLWLNGTSKTVGDDTVG